MVEKKVPVIQKADKGNNIVIFNRNGYILKLGKILEDTFKFKRVNKKEEKALNHLIQMEEWIMSPQRFGRSRQNF